MTREEFAQQMAAKAYHQELVAARALGFPDRQCYMRGFAVLDEVYHMVFAPERPLVQTRFRPMEKS